MLHQQLREATADVHRRVEGRLRVMDPRLTLRRYTRIVAAFYSIYRPLEARVQGACGDSPLGAFAATRRKAGRLEGDLQALGYSAAEVGTVRPSAHVPALRTPDEALGALYVTEGAALGGQFIAKHVSRVLGLGPETGLSFFTGDGTATPVHWQRFRDLLSAQPAGAAPAVVAAAVATFSCFDNTFAEME